MRELGGMMWHERADPAHLRGEPLDEREVGRQVRRGLVRGPDHEATTYGEPSLSEIVQAAHPIVKRHLVRMEQAVVLAGRRLVT